MQSQSPQFFNNEVNQSAQPKSFSQILEIANEIPITECKTELETYQQQLYLSQRINMLAKQMQQQKLQQIKQMEQRIKQWEDFNECKQKDFQQEVIKEQETNLNLELQIQKLQQQQNQQNEKNKILEQTLIQVQNQLQNIKKEHAEKLQVNGQLDQELENQLQSKNEMFQEIQNLENQKQNQQDELSNWIQKRQEDKQIYKDYIIQRKQNTFKIQDLKGNLRVICRLRPLFNNEKNSKNLQILSDNMIEVNYKKKQQTFVFDKIFDGNSSQESVFNEIQDLISGTLEGKNLCIFAYGQTGSGKTYTMIGDQKQPGIIMNSTQYLLKNIQEIKSLGWEFQIFAQFLEIYNDKILDLFEDSKTKLQAFSTNLIEPKEKLIDSPEAVLEILNTALQKRQTAQTSYNFKSSRSHCIFTLILKGQHQQTQESVESTMNLIDLAGSENASMVSKENQDECKFINKSLSALGSVIQAIAQKNNHVPYRNSKLTELLKNSLGGKSICLMFLNIQDKLECQDQTFSSLRFGSQAIQCKIGQAM